MRVRPDGHVALLTQPGRPERRIARAPRADRDCLAEELRRLDPDDVYGEVITKGMALLAAQPTTKPTTTPTTKPAAGSAAQPAATQKPAAAATA